MQRPTTQPAVQDMSSTTTSMLQRHPLTRALRYNAALSESQMYDDVSLTIRSTMFNLLGSGKMTEVPPVFWDHDSKTVTILYHLGSSLSGFPGILHGGVLATIIDEGFATCLMKSVAGRIPMTTDLSLRYRKPAPTGELYALRAKMTDMADECAKVQGTIELLGEHVAWDNQPDQRNVVVSAEGSFKWISPLST